MKMVRGTRRTNIPSRVEPATRTSPTRPRSPASPPSQPINNHPWLNRPLLMITVDRPNQMATPSNHQTHRRNGPISDPSSKYIQRNSMRTYVMLASSVMAISAFGIGSSVSAQTPPSSTSTTSTSTTSTTKPSPSSPAACAAAKNHGEYVRSQPKPSGPGGRSAAAHTDCGKPKLAARPTTTAIQSASPSSSTVAPTSTTGVTSTSSAPSTQPPRTHGNGNENGNENGNGKASAPGQLKKQH